MAEELKTVLGFEASKAISTLAKLDTQLAGYTKSMIAAAGATTKYNTVAGQVDAKLGQLSNAQRGVVATQNNLIASNVKVKKGLKDTGAAATETGEKTKKASKQMMLSWQSVIRIFAIQVIHQMISKITNAFSDSIQKAMELEIQLAEIQTIAPTLRSNFEGVADGVRKLSDEFGISSDIVAEGIYQTLSNQVAQGADAFKFFAAAADLSIGAVMSADAAVNLLSSTINAYGYSASQAGTISGKLFKIIELGRVRGEEFANTFGRIIVLASQIGVSLDEVGASITTLTISGLKYNEAATLITNTMLKLIRPTDALKEEFDALGIVSAEAGIQAYGFQGLLDKLRRSAGKSASAIGTLFGRVRAIRGVMGLTAEATEKYQKSLEAISEAGAKTILEAKELIFETNAKQVQIEIEQLKNAIVFDFGREALAAINKVFQFFGGAVNILKGLTVAIGLAAIGFAGFAAILFPIPAAILAIAATIGVITTNIIQLSKTANEKIEERMVREKKAIEEIEKEESDLAELRIRNMSKQLSDIAKFIIERRKGLNEYMKTSRVAEEYIGDILYDQLDDRASAYDKFVDAIEDKIEESVTNIANSQKKIFDLQRMMDRASFDASIKGASELTKSVVANQKATRLMNQAMRAFRAGKTERAEEYFTEAKSMVDMAVSSAEIAGNTGAEYQARKNMTRLYNEQMNMQKRVQENEVKKARIAQKHYAEEKARADRIKSYIEKLRDIRLFGKDGKIKFPTAKAAKAEVGRLLTSLEREFTAVGAKANIFKKLDLQKQLDDLMRPWEDAITRKPVTLRFAYEQYIDETYKNIEAYFAAHPIPAKLKVTFEKLGIDVLTAPGMKEAPQKIVDIEKEMTKVERMTVGLSGKQNAYTNAIKNSKDAMYAFIENITTTKNELRESKKAWEDSFSPMTVGKSREMIAAVEEELAAVVKQTRGVAPAALQALEAVEGTFDPELYTSAVTRLDIYADNLEKTGRVDAAAPIRTLITNLKAAALTSTKISAQPFSEGDRTIMRETIRETHEGLKGVQQEVGPNLGAAAAAGASGVTMATSQEIAALQTVEIQAYQTAAAVAAIGGATAVVTGNYGKLLYRAVGGPSRGTDTIPAMLSPGEFVVNAASTRKFFSQLVAINAGKKPVYREQGGPTTTIGDVNITVTGASAPKQTARETMYAFKREMRRRSATL